jgi:hypothetical protein
MTSLITSEMFPGEMFPGEIEAHKEQIWVDYKDTAKKYLLHKLHQRTYS